MRSKKRKEKLILKVNKCLDLENKYKDITKKYEDVSKKYENIIKKYEDTTIKLDIAQDNLILFQEKNMKLELQLRLKANRINTLEETINKFKNGAKGDEDGLLIDYKELFNKLHK